MHRRNKKGYSLVEVSLALLVVAIGLLTIFALFPGGLDLSRKSVDATEVAAFAEFVFASLDGMASSTDWNSFTNASLPLTDMLAKTPLQPSISHMGNSKPQLFYWMPSYYKGDYNVAPGVETYQVASFTYLLDIGQTGVVSRYARLEVWPGDVTNRVWTALLTNGVFEGSTVFYRTYLPLK